MNEYAERQEWVRRIIATKCDGNQAIFARRIGKDSSYLSRILLPEGQEHAKWIGEKTIKAIMQAFPDDPPPTAAVQFIPRERRASDDVTALQIAVESLCVALLRRVPGAAAAFLADTSALAERKNFSDEHGELGILVKIAQQAQSNAEVEPQVLRRADSGRRTKRGK